MQGHGRQLRQLRLLLVDLAAFELVAENEKAILQLLHLLGVGRVLCAQGLDGPVELVDLGLARRPMGTRGHQCESLKMQSRGRVAAWCLRINHRLLRQESAKTERGFETSTTKELVGKSLTIGRRLPERG